MGSKFTRRIQMGREQTAGTAVAATSIQRAVGVLDDDSVFNRHVEDVNLINGTTDQYIARKGGKITIDYDPLSFEQLPYVLDSAIAEATPVKDGSGSDYIYTYAFPTSSTSAAETKTIEAGDEDGAEELDYAIVQKFAIEGRSESQVTGSSDWYGRQVVPTTFTNSLTVPTVAPILFGNAKLYIDDNSGSYGGTEIVCTLLGFRFEVDTGLVPKYCANGTLTFGTVKRTGFVPRLSLTFEHNATSIAEKVDWKSNNPRLFKILIEGPAVATGGTVYSKKSLIIEMAGVFEKINGLSEMNGNNIVEGVAIGAYDRTDTSFGQIIVVNELSTLP